MNRLAFAVRGRAVFAVDVQGGRECGAAECLPTTRPTIRPTTRHAPGIRPCHSRNVCNGQLLCLQDDALAEQPCTHSSGQVGQPLANGDRSLGAVVLVLRHDVGGGFLVAGFACTGHAGFHALNELVLSARLQDGACTLEQCLHLATSRHVNAHLVHERAGCAGCGQIVGHQE